MMSGFSFRASALAAAFLVTPAMALAQSFSASSVPNGSAFVFGSAQAQTGFGVGFNAFLNHMPTVFTLDSFTFYAASGTPGDVELVISELDRANGPVGSALFRQTYSYNGGNGPLVTFSNMNVRIDSHTDYIAYVTASGSQAPSMVEVRAADSRVDPVFSLWSSDANQGWSQLYEIPQFSMDLHVGAPSSGSGVVAAVPEPSTYALMGACLAVLVFSARRRSAQVSDQA